jgi:hypothetical protein
MIGRILTFFSTMMPKTELQLRDEYLSESKDRVDLEYRMKRWEQRNLTGGFNSNRSVY